MLDLNIFQKDSSHHSQIYNIFHNPILLNWGWAIAFFLICTFNGWMLNISSASLSVVIYFATFPLGTSVYVFSKNTKVLTISLLISQAILALIICSLEYSVSIVIVVFYSLNLLFFAFILTDVTRENGGFIPVSILYFILVLLTIFGWEWIGKIVWYCNLIFSANKAEKKIKKFLDNFDTTMLTLCGIAALGLALGWRFAGISI